MGREIREIGFVGRTHVGLPIEVLDFGDLVSRMGDRHVGAAQRPRFEMLILVREGSGGHIVDFDSVALRAGRMVAIRPGQVQPWVTTSRVDASVVLARPEVRRLRDDQVGSPACALDAGSLRTAIDLVEALDREQRHFASDEATVRVMIDLYSALVRIFERASPTGTGDRLPEASLAFRSAIDADPSPSCGVLGQRLLLEARRHLAHTDEPVARVATVLGFADAPAFNKFFRRLTGDLPSQFRAGLRSSGCTAEPTERPPLQVVQPGLAVDRH